jgi:electron transfer flavoprotein alpha subunit
MVASVYGVSEAQPEIWAFLEQSGARLEDVSLELIGKARLLADQAGWKVTGLLIGDQVEGLAADAFACGADQVILIEHPLLADFTVDTYTHAACAALMQARPGVLLLGATPNSRDLAGRLAVRLRTGLNADCIDVSLDAGRGVLVSTVTGFGGGVQALLEMPDHRPQMATVRPGVFPLPARDERRTGQVIRLEVGGIAEAARTRIVERATGDSINLARSEVLVVGGRGIEGNFDLLRDLAHLLGGEVGSTRPPVDEGQIERERMVGQTGTVCRPRIAIVCGVSGAFHFVVGIQEADTVIAINSDPEAPIFDYADYCIVDDAHAIVPALIAALRSVGEVTYA